METIEKARQVAGSIENNPNKQANVLIAIAATYKDLHKKDMARSLLNEAEKIVSGTIRMQARHETNCQTPRPNVITGW